MTALSLAVSPLWLGAARRLHRVAAFQRVSLRYVFRIAFGRQADRISSAAALVWRLLRRGAGAIGGRRGDERAALPAKIEPQIEDARAERAAND